MTKPPQPARHRRFLNMIIADCLNFLDAWQGHTYDCIGKQTNHSRERVRQVVHALYAHWPKGTCAGSYSGCDG